jgi:3-deoxy-D-manno-octulosonate 8-phosphate phosphatase KdsC-like HAD superfamily phosphatase
MGRADLHPLMLQMAVHYISKNGGRGAWRDFAA